MHPLHLFKYCPVCGSPHFEEHNFKSKKCADCGFVYYFNSSAATVAFILNSKNELLVCRRAKDPAKGTLDLSGGFIDMFETAEEGVAREVTAFSVITDTSRNYKLTVFSYELLPKYALLDPEMIMSVPPMVAASCGIDALIHAWEAYTSLGASPFSDAMAEKAMELIGGNIRRFVANRKDEEAACAMMSGSMFAGIAFAWARLGDVHAMSHPVSAFFGVQHGVANSILLPVIVEYNALADHGRYEKIYNYISEDKEPVKDFKPEMLVAEIKKLNASLGIPKTLSEVGVTEDKIPQMAVDAMKSGNIAANPRQTTLKDVEMLYRKAL